MPDDATLEERFAVLLEQGAQRLEAGQPWEPEKDPAIPPELVTRLEGARECLALLQQLGTENRTGHGTPTEPATPGTVVEDAGALAAGRTIGRYTIQGELGRGGMGVVYKAQQNDLRRVVALKMILAGIHADAGLRRRFRREAEMVAALRHPHIVHVYEASEHEGCPYFSLEYMDGDTLAAHIAGRPQSPREAAEIVCLLAQAVQYAHDSGIIHRDLKPSNILLQHRTASRRSASPPDSAPAQLTGPLSARYFIKVADFGLARELDDEATRTGNVLGTPSYMAPEQAAGGGREVGPRADVYSLGAILYELLTGKPPFKGKSKLETLELVRRQEPVAPRRLQRQVPTELELICLKCLEKSTGARYATAQALAEDLERWQRDERPLGIPGRLRRWARGVRRYPAAIAAGLLVSCLLLGAYYADPGRPLRQLQRSLAGRTPTVLIGPTGPPRWYQFLAGGELTAVGTAPDGAWAVNTWSRCILELAPHPGHAHFRVSATVFQEGNDGTGMVGLYVARSPLNGYAHADLMAAMSYNDGWSRALLHSRLFRNAKVAAPENYVNLHPYIYHYNIGNDERLGGVTITSFLPVAGNEPRYRQLEIVVSPHGVQGSWNGVLGDHLAANSFAETVALNLARVQGGKRSEDGIEMTQIALDPLGGVGLLLERSSAWFKDVTITPLGEAE